MQHWAEEMLRCDGNQDVTEVSSFTAATHHLSFSSLFLTCLCEWQKLSSTQHRQLWQSSDSPTVPLSFPPFTLPLVISFSLSVVHFSPVWAQGSWSHAMLSQQRRDADGRAAQSGIIVHCRALHTRGREEKHQQSKRGRSLAGNDKTCTVSSSGKSDGVSKETQGGWKGKKA